MENRLRIINKILMTVLIGAMFFWSIATNGLFSLVTLVFSCMFILIIFSNKHHPADERLAQIKQLATSSAFVTTIGFIIICQTMEYMKTGKTNPVYGYILCVMLVSQLVYSMILRKSWALWTR